MMTDREKKQKDKKQTDKPLRVLVTAGAGGIGRVIAESFAEVGGQIHICDISDEALSEAAGTHPAWG
jgi:NAD(P)-dependent dehydrogenase (short-subunit alcohol dehydrogenase family)